MCHLDTGVNRGHPLLELALRPEEVLSVDPTWQVTDQSGHGTEMAGLAPYGPLTSLLSGSGPIELVHRLESVKILPDFGENVPIYTAHYDKPSHSRRSLRHGACGEFSALR